MSRPVSGKTTTYQYKVKKKNGYSYVYQRTEKYDPSTKRMIKVGSVVLLGKVKDDDPSQTILKTRPKKPSSKKQVSQPQVQAATASDPSASSGSGESPRVEAASRLRAGACQILDCIAEKTGIESDIYSILDKGTADKLISCARFLVCSANEPLSRVRTWQLTHPIPYEDGLSKDICHRLTQELGTDETFRQRLFKLRFDRQPADEIVVAVDGSTVSTYSENQVAARYGFNKDGDGLPTIKWMDLYASRTHEPLAFSLQPGNIPDVVSIHNTLEQLEAVIGGRRVILISDNGFYSDSNAYELISGGYDFISRVELNTGWVHDRLEKERQHLESSSCCCDNDGYVVGVTRRVFHTFHEKPKEGAEPSSVRRICYLHFFLDMSKRSRMSAEFNTRLKELEDQIMAGYPLDSMNAKAKKMADAFLEVTYGEDSISVRHKEENIIKEKEDYGIFSLISYGESSLLSDTARTFKEYICREHIEDHFRAEKNSLDGNHVRSWYGENYMGKVIINFVALCYEERLWSEIARIKQLLQKDIADSKASGKNKTIAAKKQKLLTWLNGMSLHELLSWFDAIENIEVSTQIRSKKWSTEVLERDKMFLDLLGVTAS